MATGVTDVLKIVQGAIDLVRKIKEISEKTKDAELKNAVADLSLQLADAKMRLVDVLDENSRLKTRLQLIESHAARAEGLLVKGGLYFDASGDGPFCPHCYDSKRQVSRLTKQKDCWVVYGDYECPACRQCFNKEQS